MAKLFSTNDNKYLVFFSISYSEMGGEINSYGIGVYDIENKTFFDGSINGSEFIADSTEDLNGANEIFENYEIIYSPNEISIPVDGGEIIIDLINQKFSSN
jgi:hypothetical protein